MKTSRLLCSTLTMASVLLAASAAFAQVDDPTATEPIPPEPAPVAAAAAPAALQPVVTDAEPVATFGMAGQFAISAERLFGVAWESDGTDEGGVKDTDTRTTISLLSNPLGSVLGLYSFARVAGDYFVTNGLSLGAGLGYFTTSGHQKREQAGVTAEADTGSVSGFLLAPRLGFAAMFTPTVGIWPKGGITYASISSKDSDGNDRGSSSWTALSLEAPLIITPVPHAGLSIGPTFDYGIAGSNDATVMDANGATTTVSIDHSTMAIGLHAGMFLYF